jgi:hypothetical protein
MENNGILPETITTLGINCDYANQCYIIANVEHNPNVLKRVDRYCSKEGVNCAERDSIIRRNVKNSEVEKRSSE